MDGALAPGGSRKKEDFGGEEVGTSRGSFCRIEELLPDAIALPFPGPELILNNLQLVYGIGPRTAAALRESGYDNLEKLASHPKWGAAAAEILRLIARRELRRLQGYGAREEELIGFFSRPEIVFIDLETTGFSPSNPLFLVGLLFFTGERPRLLQLLARDYSEEEAVLEAAGRLLSRFKVAVSYNGRSFDFPYLAARMRFFGLPPVKIPHHLDLVYQTRRFFRRRLPDCRLRTTARYLLAREEPDGIPGSAVPAAYHSFIATGETALMREILRHNREDLLVLAQLVKVIGEKWKEMTGHAD
ncbi:MAG: hypothetical protein GX085_05205 [Firmicutes bacterium]|nr:hypothetical protein [Bacillota bacterium]